MRKIYPPPFNKFAVFVLYGLLSMTIIALAQDVCDVGPLDTSKLEKLETIGYVRLDMDPKQIKWNLYNFINVIVNVNLLNDTNTLKQIDEFVSARNSSNPSNSSTKILLSIKNYDLTLRFDNTFQTRIATVITAHNLDGVDIEYPGKRSLCPQQPWNMNQNNRNNQNNQNNQNAQNAQTRFSDFLTRSRSQLQNKTWMLTVGANINGRGIIDPLTILNNVDYLNIETYYYSFYENSLEPVDQDDSNPNPSSYYSYPNAPFESPYRYGGFKNGYVNWFSWFRPGIKAKIIMGVDLGNTIQLVSNKNITKNQTVDTITLEITPNLPFLDKIKPINISELPCSFDPNIMRLYSWPWKEISSTVLDSTKNYCETKLKDWTRKTDNSNLTPWLYKESDLNNTYYYVSYEDISSLRTKLKYVIDNSIAGVSISDVSYDDGEGTLLNYIRVGTLPTLKSPGYSPGHSPTTDPAKASGAPNNITGPIVGGVIGSLIGLAIVGAAIFGLRQKSLKSKDFAIPKGPVTKSPVVPTPVTPTTVPAVTYVTAMFDFIGKEENDLSFKKGDKIEVLEKGDGPNDWWVGRVNGVVGEFPGNYVKEA